TVILTGGEVRVPKWSMTGDFTLDTIAQIKAPKSILGCSGISVQRGLTTIVAQEMRVNALMLEQSEQRIIVVDSSKLGKDSSFRYGDVDQIDMLITDRDASGEQLALLRRAGVGEVIEVGTP
ncbi:MAG TPA: DeoR/GlpR transcriptional regulator, partial [Atopobiaceae bacterium]|nr:DeoR/GlpR transcriptional regulator [Atopobiaceae bacterium]